MVSAGPSGASRVSVALLGYVSEARWLRHARQHLRHLFPYLPQQPGCNKRLRRLAGTIGVLIAALGSSQLRRGYLNLCMAIVGCSLISRNDRAGRSASVPPETAKRGTKQVIAIGAPSKELRTRH